MHFPSCRITNNSWHSHPIFRNHQNARSHTGPKLDLNKHVSSLLRGILFYIRALRHIRPALSEFTAATLGTSVVQSRLDYANSIMYGMSASNMHRPQSAQNSLTRVVLPFFRRISASEWLGSKLLHLPIRSWQLVSHLIFTISSNYTSHH